MECLSLKKSFGSPGKSLGSMEKSFGSTKVSPGSMKMSFQGFGETFATVFGAIKAIEYSFFHRFSSRMIRFYGVGEPTQEFELIKKIRNYAYSLTGSKLNVEIQTNLEFFP